MTATATPETLKQVFKRHNETENIVLTKIIDKFPDVNIRYGNETPSIDFVLRHNKGKNVLILDAKTPVLTDCGNNKKVEFLFINKEGELTWIDAKQLKTKTNLTETIIGNSYDAEQCPGRFMYVTAGKGFESSRTIQTYNKHFNRASIPNALVFDLNEFINHLN